MFSTGLTALVESIVGVFVLALVVRLDGSTTLLAAATDLSSGNASALSTLVLSSSFIAVVLEYMVPAAVVALVVFILASGFVYSAEYGSYCQAVDGSSVGISEVMTKFTERWRPMAWTLFLSYLLTLLPAGIGIGVALWIVALRGAGFLVVPALLAAAVGVVASLTLSLLFIYTPVAVSAEKSSGLRAILTSARCARKDLGAALAYSVVYIVLVGAVTGLASIIPVANLPLSSLASVGILILVTPVLHLTKTEIFVEINRDEPVERELFDPLFSDLLPFARVVWRKFREGLTELKSFTLDVRNVPYHVLASFALLVGILLGERIGTQGLTQVFYALGYVPGKINPLVTGSAPGTVGVYIFFHNWEAALSTALSGVWFSAASFVTLVLNGALIGVVVDLVPNTTMLLAALLPHGVIELPSFVVASSAGIKLGVTFLKWVRSGDAGDETAFHVAARQTVYVVIGLALFFFVAGFIEGNITPVIMKMAGWSS